MSDELLTSLAIFTLAILVGFEVISKVPATLHTPLMSGANSIHGIVLVGAMIIAAEADNPVSYALAFVAMVFGAMNVVGGYVVTDRMLQMFRKKPTAPKAGTGGVSDAVFAEVSAEFSEQELAYLSSAIASINVWNRLGVAYRWTPPARQKAVDAAAS